MKRFAGLVCAVMAATVLIASCSKDKESGRLTFDSPALFLQPGAEVTVSFTSSNVSGYSVTSKPTGWADPVVNSAAKTLTITAPATFDDDEVKTGSLVMTGMVNGGSSVSATLFVGVVDTEDISSRTANSYLINSKETNYLFDATKKGDGSSLATASLGVIWQSQSSLIQYLELRDGKASFYVAADSDDGDKIKEGNAVIGAYDANGMLIWSWHIWAADYDPEAADGSVDFNGYTMMTRNLGALAQSNSSVTDILASYGLYYQWGRKDPFIGPSAYNAAKGESAAMYNGSGSRVYLKTAVSSAETGTMEYAVQNPLTFIVGVSGSDYDWLWSHSDALWSADNNIGHKSVNDPCPAGWRVAPSAAFAGLSIKETIEGVSYEPYYNKFGWTLTDGKAESLFIGAGRRIYRHTQEDDTQGGGSIQNFYPTPMPSQVRSEALYNQPWVGYYWTTSTSDAAKSSAFYFWFDKSNVAASGVQDASPQYRANGMSVRCVKVQSR